MIVIGLDEMLLIEIELDDPKARLTHSAVYAEEYFALLNLAPIQLKIAGPSVSLLNEMILASDALLKAAPTLDVDLLVLQAESDYLVDNEVMDSFMTVVGSKIKNTSNSCDTASVSSSSGVCYDERLNNSMEIMIGAYHVLLNEQDRIYKRVMETIDRRLSR